MALTLTDGCLNSSVKYSKRSDGSAKNKSMSAGTIVHTVSTCCASVVNREEYLLSINATSAYATSVMTSVSTRRA